MTSGRVVRYSNLNMYLLKTLHFSSLEIKYTNEVHFERGATSLASALGWTENVCSPDILEEDVRFNVQAEDISQRGQAGPARGGGER